MVLGADGVDQLFVSKAELKAQKAAAKAAKAAKKDKSKVTSGRCIAFCILKRCVAAALAAASPL